MKQAHQTPSPLLALGSKLSRLVVVLIASVALMACGTEAEDLDSDPNPTDVSSDDSSTADSSEPGDPGDATDPTDPDTTPPARGCASADDCVVGGCSSQLCMPASMGGIDSTCEWMEAYACYRDEYTQCGCFEGACGWEQTDALAECLVEAGENPDLCSPGSTRPSDDGCNTCTCVDGTGWACTDMACDPAPTCDEGDTRPAGDGCNTCFCSEGAWACTERACPPPTDPVCDEGDSRPAGDDCNTCYCSEGAWACTEMACGGPECADGDTKPADDGCNTCTCTGGHWGCTLMACEPVHGACERDADCVIGGCSGQLCVLDDGEMGGSTCEWLEEYACFREDFASCGCNAGVCGWAESAELDRCIAAARDE